MASKASRKMAELVGVEAGAEAGAGTGAMQRGNNYGYGFDSAGIALF